MKERSSVADYLGEFEGRGNACAYIHRRGYRTERWSYRRVAETALRFARELEARKIRRGDRVMLWGMNCAEWVAAFFGCSASGVVVVPMDNGASADFARRVVRQVDAKLLVCSRGHARENSNQIIPGVPALIFEGLERTLERYAATVIHGAAVSRDDILQVVFTSGTTAEPKGVVITHGNVLANVAPLEDRIRGYLKYEHFVHPIRFLNLLPLSHVFGQFLGMFLPPLLGGVVIFQEELKPSEIIRTIRRERASVLVSVPGVLQSLRQKVERDLEDQGRLPDFQKRFLFSGQTFLAAMVDISANSPPVRMEILGIYFWWGGARPRD
jgi:long-chain acyl-CoA synthetase